MKIKIEQNNYDNSQGIINVNEIKKGLSVDEVRELFKISQQLKAEDKKELEQMIKQMKEAETDAEKKTISQKICGFLKDRAGGIIDSLAANLIWAAYKGS